MFLFCRFTVNGDKFFIVEIMFASVLTDGVKCLIIKLQISFKEDMQ